MHKHIMFNQQSKSVLVALVLSAIVVLAVALPAANALTPSTVYGRYQQKTDLYPGGQHICGEKLCSAQEWSAMKKQLDTAQSSPTKCSELKAWMYCGQPMKATKTSNK